MLDVRDSGELRIPATEKQSRAITATPLPFVFAVLFSALAGFLLVILAGSLVGCARFARDPMLDQLVEMEGEADREVSAQRLEEIEREIQRYRKEVERTVDAMGQLGSYYKMLAVEYMRGGMYGAAYDALEQAIAIYPENSILFFYSGVCAARMSMAEVIAEDRQQWLERSEALYRRALALDPGYDDALYGLSILYVFELDRPEEAEGLLVRLLADQSKEIDGRFLLARVYYSLGKLESAIEVYRDIESLSDVAEKRQEARDARVQIEEELYGAQ
ncbi:MAG: tetratricopeptide repeat protein [Spirochaetaceae bacterium]|nr:MAG: tetratricopeptide repeat protein [Spirochaetaceae bacterium]